MKKRNTFGSSWSSLYIKDVYKYPLFVWICGFFGRNIHPFFIKSLLLLLFAWYSSFPFIFWSSVWFYLGILLFYCAYFSIFLDVSRHCFVFLVNVISHFFLWLFFSHVYYDLMWFFFMQLESIFFCWYSRDLHPSSNKFFGRPTKWYWLLWSSKQVFGCI